MQGCHCSNFGYPVEMKYPAFTSTSWIKICTYIGQERLEDIFIQNEAHKFTTSSILVKMKITSK